MKTLPARIHFMVVLLTSIFVLMLSLTSSVLAQETGIIATAWSPDGSKIAISGADGLLQIRDTANQVVRTFTGLSGTIYSVAWSPDSSKIASAGEDKLIRIWNVSNGQSLANLTGHKNSINSLDWSTDGRKLVSVSPEDTLSLRTWNAVTYRALNTLQAGNLQAVKWRPISNQIAILSIGTGVILLPDDSLNILPQNLQNYRVGPSSSVAGFAGAVAFKNDGNTMAVSYEDGKIYIWDVLTNQQISVLQGHTGWVGALSWSPDGTRLASASNDGTVKVWDVATGQQVVSYPKPESLTTSVAWSPDGSQLAFGGDDGTLQIVSVSDLPMFTPTPTG